MTELVSLFEPSEQFREQAKQLQLLLQAAYGQVKKGRLCCLAKSPISEHSVLTNSSHLRLNVSKRSTFCNLIQKDRIKMKS